MKTNKCACSYFGGKKKQTGAQHLFLSVTQLHTKEMLKIKEKSLSELGLGKSTELKSHHQNVALS